MVNTLKYIWFVPATESDEPGWYFQDEAENIEGNGPYKTEAQAEHARSQWREKEDADRETRKRKQRRAIAINEMMHRAKNIEKFPEEIWYPSVVPDVDFEACPQCEGLNLLNTSPAAMEFPTLQFCPDCGLYFDVGVMFKVQ